MSLAHSSSVNHGDDRFCRKSAALLRGSAGRTWPTAEDPAMDECPVDWREWDESAENRPSKPAREGA